MWIKLEECVKHLKTSGRSIVDDFRGDLLAKLARAMTGKKPPLFRDGDVERLRECSLQRRKKPCFKSIHCQWRLSSSIVRMLFDSSRLFVSRTNRPGTRRGGRIDGEAAAWSIKAWKKTKTRRSSWPVVTPACLELTVENKEYIWTWIIVRICSHISLKSFDWRNQCTVSFTHM